MTETEYATSIELPTDQVFKDLKHAKRCALDIDAMRSKNNFLCS
ncbi:hypothetical protein LSH36_727g01008 [Paralvinella palmiformis]|uniref:Uncharacterized protein n=1 Tax=Paralvinella palmiformis TaxID=53620 RepID=A0AAD9J2L2_9ANNE|nr:hypothetical protein LSH36_727g01008 [Paralvinella palmiformis]